MSKVHAMALLGCLLIAIVPPASAADAPDTFPCPPLGPREAAIRFFTDRGFPAAVIGATLPSLDPWVSEYATDDGIVWTSRHGPMTATVEGDGLARRIDLRGEFIIDGDGDLWIPWSPADLSNALLWSSELIDDYAVPDDLDSPQSEWEGPQWGNPEIDMFPGGIGIDAGDRDAEIRVTMSDGGLRVHANVVTQDVPRIACGVGFVDGASMRQL